MSCSENIKYIIKELCLQNKIAQDNGYGPFAAAICDENETILTVAHNSVILEKSSLCHAEVNAIKQIQVQYNTYDLSKYNLSICVTAEPCSMCLGAIMWSGIKHIYYGLPSSEVEKITGFDEGYKPDWQNAFAKKGIIAEGGIEADDCRALLKMYVKAGKPIYNAK